METLRKLDALGRIVIPQALREQLNILEGDEFRITEEGNKIILERHAVKCMVCDEDANVKKLNRVLLCGVCHDALEKSMKEAG
ncbi:MAG: AbrB/MazE/SpoVT family DNA-binding domain-containing protein [Defluviitaleaceae bacterium]|nr:AbrB/MazE/SpoVT family DNA-binding domain-containing protein [Defluviitaleaceae bacterium]